jgi:hypothetical protein
VKNRHRQEKKTAELSADSKITQITRRQEVIEEQCSDRLRVITLAPGPARDHKANKGEATYPANRLAAGCKPGREEDVGNETWSRDKG